MLAATGKIGDALHNSRPCTAVAALALTAAGSTAGTAGDATVGGSNGGVAARGATTGCCGDGDACWPDACVATEVGRKI